MMQPPSHRLATLLQTAHRSLEGTDDALSQSERLRERTKVLHAGLSGRKGLGFVKRHWAATLLGMQHSRQDFQRAVLRRKARLRRRILGLNLLRVWRAIRWWLLLFLIIAGLTLSVVHYWSWISDLVVSLIGLAPQSVDAPDFIGPRLPAGGAGP